jgi:hypothetical protein
MSSSEKNRLPLNCRRRADIELERAKKNARTETWGDESEADCETTEQDRYQQNRRAGLQNTRQAYGPRGCGTAALKRSLDV